MSTGTLVEKMWFVLHSNDVNAPGQAWNFLTIGVYLMLLNLAKEAGTAVFDHLEMGYVIWSCVYGIIEVGGAGTR